MSLNGKVRTYRIRPWLSALGIGAFAVFLSAYVGATLYLVYRDDLLGGTLARQVALQHSYEDRIAALRAEIDRVTSKQVVEAEGVEERLATLLERQALIGERQASLEGLLDKARATGLQVPTRTATAPTPMPKPQRASMADGPEPLAYAPAKPRPGDVITGTLIRGDEQKPAAAADLEPLLFEVQSAVEAAEDRQTAALDALTAEAQAHAEKLAAALAPISAEAADADTRSQQGGPFVPVSGMHFVERAAMLSRTLDEIVGLRRFAEAMPLKMPLRAARISSRFGYRDDPFLHRPALHAGLDFAAASGTEVAATAAGTVVSAGWNGGYGKMIEIRHASGLSTRYGHLSAILVEAGAEVTAGTPIGRVGSTGRSTGPHLHYETRRDGKAVNPAPYLAAGRAL